MSRGDFYKVVELTSQRSGDDKFLSPSRQRHGLLEDTVGIGTSNGHHGEVVAIEHGYFFAVGGCHPGATQIATSRVIVMGTHLIGLSLRQDDSVGLTGEVTVQGVHLWCDVNRGLALFGGNDEKGRSVISTII